MIPMLLIVGLHVLALVIQVKNHGREKVIARYNANAACIGFIMMMGLYYWAGLFNV